MTTLEKPFSAFRNASIDEIVPLSHLGMITKKEVKLFMTICTNSENTIKYCIDKFRLSKEVEDKDFQWLMNMYASMCYWELYDLLDNIERSSDDMIKNALDVNREQLINHLQKIIGGEGINKFSKMILNFVELQNKESKNLDEYLSRRTAFIFKSFQEGGVNIPIIKDLDVQKISDEVYQNSLMNFIKTCV